MVCPGREEPYETRVCAVQNGELNPCCKREKLKEVLLGHQPYRMAKALWDYSMVEKHEASEHARLVVVQDPRDTVKAGLPESQSPEDGSSHPPERRLKPAPALSPGWNEDGATSGARSDAQ